MSEHQASSWARMVAEGDAAPVSSSERFEFTWKTAKKGRLRPFKAASAAVCAEDHCQLSEAHCRRAECIARIERQLTKLRAENASSTLAFESRLAELDTLRQDISENCKTGEFFSDDMEVTRLALAKLIRRSAKPTFCECPPCRLAFYETESALLQEKLTAAQARLSTLKDYRIANETATTIQIPSNSKDGCKYFTPVGRSKAKGVSALRPTLQMQSSYNFAALTTNSMAARPLKVAWEDKPKASKTRPQSKQANQDT